ncbi:MAG: DUF934 domain-containing protein [Rubrivivax sp.]
MEFIDNSTQLPEDTLVMDNQADVIARADEARSAHAIALQFPKWTDGRAYSQAVLLRARVRYGGRLIASGEVLADMLPLLQRCGFDAVQMRADQNPETALRTLGVFDHGHLQDPFRTPLHYQASASERRAAEPLPATAPSAGGSR